MITKVVSGGQTGVDQAALLVATEIGIPVGGWCPKGGLDENGICILECYPSLIEASTINPDERTKLNIHDSDGTLIIVPGWPLPNKIKDGTRLTIEEAQRLKKHLLVISLLDKDNATDRIQEWVYKNNIEVINIAGPRESSSPGIHQEACEVLQEFFMSLKPRARL